MARLSTLAVLACVQLVALPTSVDVAWAEDMPSSIGWSTRLSIPGVPWVSIGSTYTEAMDRTKALIKGKKETSSGEFENVHRGDGIDVYATKLKAGTFSITYDMSAPNPSPVCRVGFTSRGTNPYNNKTNTQAYRAERDTFFRFLGHPKAKQKRHDKTWTSSCVEYDHNTSETNITAFSCQIEKNGRKAREVEGQLHVSNESGKSVFMIWIDGCPNP